MIRRRRSSRFTLLLAVFGLLAASLGAVPATSAAELPPGDLFVVASSQDDAGVGGAWWTGDVSITVDVFDGGGVLQATLTTDTSPDPDSNYWWGVQTGIAIHPGWTVTATGDQTSYTVTTEVTDVVVEGWDGECTVYGTTTYDPTDLRVDVYSPVNLSRYVTWTTDSSVPAVHSWTADFCVTPQAGESGEAVDNDLAAPSGQAIHHDGALGATMYHYSGPAPWFSVDAGVGASGGDGVWGEQWLADSAVTVTFDDDDDPTNGVLHEFNVVTDSQGRFGAYWDTGYFQTFNLEAGQFVTVTDGATTKDTWVTALRVDNVDFDAELVTGTADPFGNLNVGLFEGYDCTDSDVESPQCWRNTTSAGDGSWSVDFSTDPTNDLHAGGSMLVWESDDDGDATNTRYGPLEPGPGGPEFWFSVETPHQVWGDGEHWPLGATIDLTVDDLSGGDPFTASTQVVSTGFESWEVGFRFELEGVVDIQPGHIVSITSDFDGDFVLDVEKELLVADIGAIEVDPDTGIVSGYVPPEEWVNVHGGNEFGGAWRNVQADLGGFFTANLAISAGAGEEGDETIAVPFPDGTGGAVQVPDDDGDSTNRGWCIGCDGGESTPMVVASVWPETLVRGSAWNGADLHITLDKTPLDTGGPLDWTLDLSADTYEDGIWYNGWDFEVRAPFWDGSLTLDDGDVLTVTATGGEADDVVKTLTVVRPLTAASVDRATATVTGTAKIGETVNVARWGDDLGHPHDEVSVVADGNGDWSAIFSQLWAGSTGSAMIWDDDGDGIEATWGVPFIATGVGFQEESGSVWGGFWYLDTSVTVEVSRGGTTVYLSEAVPAQDDWWRGFGTDLGGFDLQVDDVVTVTGNNSGTINMHTVLELTVEWTDWQEDGSGNTVSGTTNAPDGWLVSVEAHEYDAHRSTQVGADGSWSIDFDDLSETSGSVHIEPGVGGRVEVLDLEGNRTWAPWGTQGHGGSDPILFAQAEDNIWIRGYGYDGLGPLEVRVNEESGLPSCTGTMIFEGEFEAFGADLCDGGEFVGGDHIGVYTPEGELIRDFTIHDVRITAVDVDANSVSGVGTVGVPVQVGIYEEGEAEDETVTLALRYAMPDETTGTWQVFFNADPDVDAGESGKMPIDGRGGDARQFEEDGDVTESQWADRQPHIYLNLLADMASLDAWPTGHDVTLDVFESEAPDALLVHTETIGAPGLYYVTSLQTDLGGIDLLSGHHVVVTNGTLELSHTVTEIAITSFDFEFDSFTGTAFDGTTVAAGAGNETSEWEVDGLVARPWTADFSEQVDFSEYNRIFGFVAEFDGAENATFFMFEAEYEELTVAPGETSVTTADGSVTVENLGEGDEMNIVTGPPPGSSGGFEYVGETLEIESDATGTPGDPLILTLRIRGEDIPPDLDPEDIVVFKDGVEVSNCVLPLDTAGDFPCVSERLRLDPSGDIELTVQTLSFSTWTMAFRSVSIAQFAATAEPVAVGNEVTATGRFLDVGKTQATGLTSTVTWSEGGECDVVPIIDDGIEASHTYLEAGVFTPTLRLYAGSAFDCATAESFELIDEAAYQYVVVYDPDGGFVTGGGWIYSIAGSYVPDPTLEGVATFGFVSKYKKGATVPTGNTEFQFHAGDLNFHSSSYDWLVVTGTPTARFKGTGTINGMGEYKFVIWAGDGEPDTFRIKIWSEDGGVETVTYDNGSAQAIGGGSIIIHTAKK